MEEFRQLCIQTYTWHREALLEYIPIDLVSILGKTIIEMVDDQLPSTIQLNSSTGARLREKVSESEKNIPIQTCVKESINQIHEGSLNVFSSKNYGGIICIIVLALGIVLDLALKKRISCL